MDNSFSTLCPTGVENENMIAARKNGRTKNSFDQLNFQDGEPRSVGNIIKLFGHNFWVS